MKTIVQDFTTHPLLPGSVLAAIMGRPEEREAQPWDHATLVYFNKKTPWTSSHIFKTSG